MEKIKIGFVSLGCPKNRVDTEIMLAELSDAGYEITAEDIEADIIIVNTCAFIESAKRESIESILDVAWLKKNSRLKYIIAAGCLAERYRDEIFAELPEVDAAIGVNSIRDVVECVKTLVLDGSRFSSYKTPDELSLGGGRILTTPEYSSYLKIAEGCDNNCSYCAIPMIRGGFRSREIGDLVEEAKRLEALGTKELILIAQDTTRYGLDIYGECSLDKLIRAITDATNIPWIRLLYCYPERITDGLVAEIRENPRVVKYIDIPIQHISDRVLSAMNRRGGSAAIRSAIARLREAVPGITLRTTVITGFPGESEEDFEELCEFVRDTEFERLGAFAYSREEDTPAFFLDGQLDEQVKEDRRDILMRAQLLISAEYNEKMIGKTLRVLCEGYDVVAEMYYGRGEGDAPEIDGKLYFSSEKQTLPGEFAEILITEAIDYDLIGERIV